MGRMNIHKDTRQRAWEAGLVLKDARRLDWFKVCAELNSTTLAFHFVRSAGGEQSAESSQLMIEQSGNAACGGGRSLPEPRKIILPDPGARHRNRNRRRRCATITGGNRGGDCAHVRLDLRDTYRISASAHLFQFEQKLLATCQGVRGKGLQSFGGIEFLDASNGECMSISRRRNAWKFY